MRMAECGCRVSSPIEQLKDTVALYGKTIEQLLILVLRLMLVQFSHAFRSDDEELLMYIKLSLHLQITTIMERSKVTI